MKRKDYEPLTIVASDMFWDALRIELGVHTNWGWDIKHKQKWNYTNLSFFQTEIEKLMYTLQERGLFKFKSHIQAQINAYIKSGEWV